MAMVLVCGTSACGGDPVEAMSVGEGTDNVPPVSCEPGAELSCTCSDGRPGTQRCLASGFELAGCSCDEDPPPPTTTTTEPGTSTSVTTTGDETTTVTGTSGDTGTSDEGPETSGDTGTSESTGATQSGTGSTGTTSGD